MDFFCRKNQRLAGAETTRRKLRAGHVARRKRQVSPRLPPLPENAGAFSRSARRKVYLPTLFELRQGRLDLSLSTLRPPRGGLDSRAQKRVARLARTRQVEPLSQALHHDGAAPAAVAVRMATVSPEDPSRLCCWNF